MICHDHEVYVSTGGFVERIIVQGRDAIDSVPRGMQIIRIMTLWKLSGLAPIPLEDKVELVKQVKKWA